MEHVNVQSANQLQECSWNNQVTKIQLYFSLEEERIIIQPQSTSVRVIGLWK